MVPYPTAAPSTEYPNLTPLISSAPLLESVLQNQYYDAPSPTQPAPNNLGNLIATHARCYVIYDGIDYGDNVTSIHFFENATVLDAL